MGWRVATQSARGICLIDEQGHLVCVASGHVPRGLAGVSGTFSSVTKSARRVHKGYVRGREKTVRSVQKHGGRVLPKKVRESLQQIDRRSRTAQHMGAAAAPVVAATAISIAFPPAALVAQPLGKMASDAVLQQQMRLKMRDARRLGSRAGMEPSQWERFIDQAWSAYFATLPKNQKSYLRNHPNRRKAKKKKLEAAMAKAILEVARAQGSAATSATFDGLPAPEDFAGTAEMFFGLSPAGHAVLLGG